MEKCSSELNARVPWGPEVRMQSEWPSLNSQVKEEKLPPEPQDPQSWSGSGTVAFPLDSTSKRETSIEGVCVPRSVSGTGRH